MKLVELMGLRPTSNWLIPVRIPMPWEITKVTEKVMAREIPERKCNHCGKVFQPLEKRTTCCSVSCGVRHAQAVKAGRVRGYKTPMEVDDRRCKICNAAFMPKNGKQLYCGEDCYRVAKAEKARERNRAGT